MSRTIVRLAPSLLVAGLTLTLATSARADIADPESPMQKKKEEAKGDEKSDDKADDKAESKTDAKTSSCSIQGSGTQSLFGFAALVLLISGAALRRRDAKAV